MDSRKNFDESWKKLKFLHEYNPDNFYKKWRDKFNSKCNFVFFWLRNLHIQSWISTFYFVICLFYCKFSLQYLKWEKKSNSNINYDKKKQNKTNDYLQTKFGPNVCLNPSNSATDRLSLVVKISFAGISRLNFAIKIPYFYQQRN